jgi:hypothetical protein
MGDMDRSESSVRARRVLREAHLLMTIKSHQIKSNQIKSNQIESNQQIKSTQPINHTTDVCMVGDKQDNRNG